MKGRTRAVPKETLVILTLLVSPNALPKRCGRRRRPSASLACYAATEVTPRFSSRGRGRLWAHCRPPSESVRTTKAAVAGAKLVLLWRRPRSPKEVVEHFADVIRTFEIGEMPAVFDSDQLGSRNSPGDVLSGLDHEVVTAGDDEGRDAQATQLGQQIIAGHLPGVAHEPDFHSSRF